jgi:hypothetical protein
MEPAVSNPGRELRYSGYSPKKAQEAFGQKKERKRI